MIGRRTEAHKTTLRSLLRLLTDAVLWQYYHQASSVIQRFDIVSKFQGITCCYFLAISLKCPFNRSTGRANEIREACRAPEHLSLIMDGERHAAYRWSRPEIQYGWYLSAPITRRLCASTPLRIAHLMKSWRLKQKLANLENDEETLPGKSRSMAMSKTLKTQSSPILRGSVSFKGMPLYRMSK